ncbi:hypothetical protein [Effusibacillus pohliae]|uniref:hypothetical protein n=1 Tax=Effusibacillus pohliae TaxID=232270 RepID=UPI000363677D|nr:hypothetical protein [Effusibacillus pohliae]
MKNLQMLLTNEAVIGFMGAIIGAIIGGVFSYLGSVKATKKSIDATQYINDRNEITIINKSSKNLITNIQIICGLVESLKSAQENLPPNLQGTILSVEHRIAPIDWFSDLSTISTRLSEDDYTELVNFFVGVTRCDDLLARAWELRASGKSPDYQLTLFWKMLPSILENKEKSINILKELIK